MLFKSEYLVKLDEIIKLIETDRFDSEDGAVSKFTGYLQLIKEIGGYTEGNWDNTWRKKIYELGNLFSKKDAGKFLACITEARISYPKNGTEILDFIHSEIAWNYFEQENEYISSLLKGLVKKYPGNPEFHHSYSLYLENNGTFEQAISEARLAIKIESSNSTFIQTAFNKEKRYINFLLKKKNVLKAKTMLRKMRDMKIYNDNVEFNNIVVSIYDRIEDHQIINERIGGIDFIVSKQINKERRRLIEILGIFAAILSFIILNISIALNNLKLKEVLILMSGMGIILMIFSITISYIFNDLGGDNFWDFLKHRKFWALAVLAFALYILIKISVII